MHEADHAASAEERRHLELSYAELRTRLTSLRSHAALIEHELRQHDATYALVRPHLDEIDVAIDRLEALSRWMRLWHDAPEPVATG